MLGVRRNTTPTDVVGSVLAHWLTYGLVRSGHTPRPARSSRFAPEEVETGSGALMEGANLLRAQLEEAMLIHAQLAGADLSGAQLEGANLRDADQKGANLIEADGLSAEQLTDAFIDATRGFRRSWLSGRLRPNPNDR